MIRAPHLVRAVARSAAGRVVRQSPNGFLRLRFLFLFELSMIGSRIFFVREGAVQINACWLGLAAGQ